MLQAGIPVQICTTIYVMRPIEGEILDMSHKAAESSPVTYNQYIWRRLHDLYLSIYICINTQRTTYTYRYCYYYIYIYILLYGGPTDSPA